MLKRRSFTAEFKRQLVEQTCQPGGSIAGLAQAHQINANQLHKWRRKILGTSQQHAGASSALIPVTVVPEAPVRPPGEDLPSGKIEIELGRARVSLCGRVDLDMLPTILSTLRPR
jgi:transposase